MWDIKQYEEAVRCIFPQEQECAGNIFKHKCQAFFDDCGGVGAGVGDEQNLREIAENIFDWWISGMNYKKWYAEKFLQMNLPFEFEDEKE